MELKPIHAPTPRKGTDVLSVVPHQPAGKVYVLPHNNHHGDCEIQPARRTGAWGGASDISGSRFDYGRDAVPKENRN